MWLLLLVFLMLFVHGISPPGVPQDRKHCQLLFISSRFSANRRVSLRPLLGSGTLHTTWVMDGTKSMWSSYGGYTGAVRLSRNLCTDRNRTVWIVSRQHCEHFLQNWANSQSIVHKTGDRQTVGCRPSWTTRATPRNWSPRSWFSFVSLV